MARQHQRYTAQQWSDLIREQQGCGDSIDVFCARKRIGTSTFTKWRRRFRDGWDLSSQENTEKPGGFVEAVSPSNQVVSLILGGGVHLELPVRLGPKKIAEFAHAVATHEQG